jgi:hypothetical protein
MKSEICEEIHAARALSFPRLMRRKKDAGHNYVVLFSSMERGTVVWSDVRAMDVGFTCSLWNIEKYEDFTGSITLSND